MSKCFDLNLKEPQSQMATVKATSNQTVVGAFLLFLLLDDVLVVLLSLCLLVLLVLCDQVVHVGLCLRELHLVHALACVPVEESFPPEHYSKRIRHSAYQALDGCGVADEGAGHC